MPALFECSKCSTKSWNVDPFSEISLLQSVHVFRDGCCPVCGSAEATDWNGQPRHIPQWKKTLYGSGMRTDFFTAPGDIGRRPDHFSFCHDYLRSYTFAGTPKLFSGMFSDGEIFGMHIKRAYRLLVSEFKATGSPVSFSVDELSADLFTIEKRSPFDEKDVGVALPCLIVTLPQPKYVTETYFIGICLLSPLEKLGSCDNLKKYILYSTLEVSNPELSSSRTIFARWYYNEQNRKCEYRSYKGGPPPQDPYQFAEYVERLACVI